MKNREEGERWWLPAPPVGPVRQVITETSSNMGYIRFQLTSFPIR